MSFENYLDIHIDLKYVNSKFQKVTFNLLEAKRIGSFFLQKRNSLEVEKVIYFLRKYESK